jgi:hypothetical protein
MTTRAMRRMTRPAVMAGSPAMAIGPRPCSPTPGRWSCRCRGTGISASSRKSSPKGSGGCPGVDDRVISLSAKGLTHGEIAAHLAEVYGAEVSKQTITAITDWVMEGLAEWQSRPLDAVYAVNFIDAINVKIGEGQVANRPIYLALGVTVDGERDVLGLWADDARQRPPAQPETPGSEPALAHDRDAAPASTPANCIPRTRGMVSATFPRRRVPAHPRRADRWDTRSRRRQCGRSSRTQASTPHPAIRR